MKHPQVALLATVLLSGCTSMNDAMTPSVSTLVDPFDSKTIIRQPPVNAASGMSEAFHILGFEWNEKFPNLIFVTAGTAFRTQSIQSLAFNADGKVFENLKAANALTDIQEGRSLRRFEIPLADFQVIATSRDVKMHLGSINAYTVSSFGPGAGNGMAIVNLKFAPFLHQVALARSKLTPASTRAP